MTSIRIQDGWLSNARRCPSPNFNQRPEESAVSLLVIHNISLPPAQFSGDSVIEFFQNRLDWSQHPFFKEIEGVEVSSHLFIRRDGELIQFVPLHQRAWHAGVSSFEGRDNCNDFSIGIELEGTDDLAYTDAQYSMLKSVTCAIQASYPEITRERITGHSNIAPGRKTDPGASFDWSKYLDALDEE